MNRLHKKCFIASAGVHSLMLLILLVGPAFLTSKNKSDDVPVLDFIPFILVDQNVMDRGNRNAKPPPAQPPAPQPPPQAPQQPPQVKPPEPEPVKQIVHVSKPDPDSVEPAKERRHLPKVSTTPMTRQPDARKPTKANTSDSDTRAQEQQVADAKRRAVRQLERAMTNIGQSTSSATSIEAYGPGNSDASQANYAAEVKRRYEEAWQAPDDSATDDAITKVTVTIANTGKVIEARISRPSGDSPVDKSVQRALDRVPFIAPFPEGAKDKQRTYTINFNLKAKRGLA